MVAVPSWSFHFWPWHLADFKKAGQGNSDTFSISSVLLVLDYLRIRGLVPSDVSKGPIIK